MKTLISSVRIATAYLLVGSIFILNAQVAGGGGQSNQAAGGGQANQIIGTTGLGAGTLKVQNTAKNRVKELLTKDAIARRWKKPVTTTKTPTKIAAKPTAKTPAVRKTTVTKRNPKTGKVTRTTVMLPVPTRELDPKPELKPNNEEEAEAETESAPLNLGAFQPDPSVDNFRLLANGLTKDSRQREAYYIALKETKKGIEIELEKYGAKNNVAGAMLAFLVINSGIYHGDVGKIKDQKAQEEFELALFKVVNREFDNTHGMADIPNRDKQALYDFYLGLSALAYSGYLNAIKVNTPESTKAAQVVAGDFLKLVMDVNPDELRLMKY